MVGRKRLQSGVVIEGDYQIRIVVRGYGKWDRKLEALYDVGDLGRQSLESLGYSYLGVNENRCEDLSGLGWLEYQDFYLIFWILV